MTQDREAQQGARPYLLNTYTLSELQRMAEQQGARVVTVQAWDAIVQMRDQKREQAEADLATVIEIAERYHSGHSATGKPCQCSLCKELALLRGEMRTACRCGGYRPECGHGAA